MTDKVQKIKDWISKEQDGLMDAQGNFEYPEHEGAYHILCNLDAYIDSMQEEPKFKTGDRIKPIDSCLGSPRTIVDVCDSWYVTDQGTLDFEFENNWELVEQKPAEWSEEDETTKNNISHIIRQYDKISKKENQPCWYVGDCLLWMQNIKDRVQPKPKQEWSGGDEAHLHSLITHLEQWIERHPNTTGADIQGENITWLKSLRPQSTWKPSDEQMKALKSSTYCQNKQMSKVLFKLYQDLKKLREE